MAQEDVKSTAESVRSVEQQAPEQTGQHQVQLRIDESKLSASYANAFRTNGTAEEVVLDFGLNVVQLPTEQQAEPQILLQVTQRVIMNYFTAKRLAITLSQAIRRHEDQFGELEIDVDKRRKV